MNLFFSGMSMVASGMSMLAKMNPFYFRKKPGVLLFSGIALICVLTQMASVSEAAPVEAKFLHKLSDFTHAPGFMWVTLSADEERGEIFVIDQKSDEVVIYNSYGMEVFRFGREQGLPQIQDAAILENGDILLAPVSGGGQGILRCNYRGEVQGKIELADLPAAHADFRIERIFYRHGSIYLAEPSRLRLVVIDEDGRFRKGIDLTEAVIACSPELTVGKVNEMEAGGINIDSDGNILFTISELFAVFIVSPEGEAKSFGRKGSVPGRFAIVRGVAVDHQGYIYVADILRSVVLIFGPDLKFVSEFGGRGIAPGSLIGPKELVVSGDRLYVSQLRERGVDAFRIVRK